MLKTDKNINILYIIIIFAIIAVIYMSHIFIVKMDSNMNNTCKTGETLIMTYGEGLKCISFKRK